jgi:hypothetical protein
LDIQNHGTASSVTFSMRSNDTTFCMATPLFASRTIDLTQAVYQLLGGLRTRFLRLGMRMRTMLSTVRPGKGTEMDPPGAIAAASDAECDQKPMVSGHTDERAEDPG